MSRRTLSPEDIYTYLLDISGDVERLLDNIPVDAVPRLVIIGGLEAVSAALANMTSCGPPRTDEEEQAAAQEELSLPDVAQLEAPENESPWTIAAKLVEQWFDMPGVGGLTESDLDNLKARIAKAIHAERKP